MWAKSRPTPLWHVDPSGSPLQILFIWLSGGDNFYYVFYQHLNACHHIAWVCETHQYRLYITWTREGSGPYQGQIYPNPLEGLQLKRSKKKLCCVHFIPLVCFLVQLMARMYVFTTLPIYTSCGFILKVREGSWGGSQGGLGAPGEDVCLQLILPGATPVSAHSRGWQGDLIAPCVYFGARPSPL